MKLEEIDYAFEDENENKAEYDDFSDSDDFSENDDDFYDDYVSDDDYYDDYDYEDEDDSENDDDSNNKNTNRKTEDQKAMQFWIQYSQDFDLLSREKERELLVSYHTKHDPHDLDLLLSSNIRLALFVAKKFQNRGLSFADLSSIAMKALWEAIQGYDPAYTTRLSTYATKKISGKIQEALRDEHCRVHVINRTSYDLRKKIDKANAESLKLTGKKRTAEEHAKAFGKTPEEIIEVLSIPLSRLISTETPLGDEKDSATIGEFIPAKNDDKNEHQEALRMIFNDATQDFRASELIVLTCLFNNIGDYSLTEIADSLNISRERVRQLKNKALKRLKADEETMKKLKKYY